jgi:tetratricopeptide (TPR) repeat protein
MRLAILLAVALGAAGVAPPSIGADEWSLAHTAAFDLVSDAGPETARAEAAALEQFGSAIARLIGPEPAAPAPPTVVLLLQPGTFQPLRPRYQGRAVDVDGFIQPAAERRVVVARLHTRGAPPGEVPRHEYVHLLLSRRMAVQPVWLAEGLAELFSTFRVEGADAVVGGPRERNLELLRSRPALPLDTVLRTRDDSALYNEGEGREMLYAQSWALVHMLLVGDGGREKVGRYLEELTAGSPERAAFREAFGEEIGAAEHRLDVYVRRPDLGSFRVPLPMDAEVSVRDMPAAEVHTLLGELLLHAGRLDDAAGHLQSALQADSSWAPAHEASADLALRRGRMAQARSHARSALTKAPATATALYRWADMLVREAGQRGEVISGEAEAEAVAALEEAVRRAPYFADAGDLLARLRPHPRAARIALLEDAWTHNPERADLGLTLASLHLDVGDTARASRALLRARLVAREEHVRFVCDHLLGRLHPLAGTTVEVDGELVGLECQAGGSLAFLVRHERRRLRLQAVSPVSVLLLDGDGEPHQRTLTCGAQSAPVQARYRLGPGGVGGPDGTLLALTFKDAVPALGH